MPTRAMPHSKNGPEEIAFRQGFINRESLAKLGRYMEQTGYGQYLLAITEKV
jgi:dTDP-glucose pyrophosphorylase